MTAEPLIELTRQRRLVLGSGSPRRVRLLRDSGVEFRQIVPEIDETIHPGEAPFNFARRMAETKASRVAGECQEDEIVLGGDTVVVFENTILGKPSNVSEAIITLETLSGRRHTVGTALALADRDRLFCSSVEKTQVLFNSVSRRQIEEYVASGEPMDKAGAYGIQGMGAFLVDTIQGKIDNVVGLPLTLLNALARETLRQL